jgi:uncharacterized protein
MHPRAIYPELEAHLSQPQVTVITGMRRVGKTTALKHLLQQVPHENKLYLDLERIEFRHLFHQSSYLEIVRGLGTLGLDITKPAVLALDEIQLVKHLPSIIKSLYDTYKLKCIVSGSSSYYLKNHFTESLAGRKQVFEMWPLDFREFLQFKQAWQPQLDLLRMQPIEQIHYIQFSSLYEEYLRYGGFPEVVLTEQVKYKDAYLRDIVNAYIELDIKLLSDFDASDSLYKLMLLLAGRVGSKLDFSKISSILGVPRQKTKDYISLLEYTYFVKQVRPFARGIDKELTRQPKIYLTDTGIANVLQKGLGSGHLFENAIALQLSRLGELHYFEKSNSLEIDFILDGNQAIEVKETPTPQDEQKLNKIAQKLDMPNATIVGRYPNPSGFKNFIWAGSVF